LLPLSWTADEAVIAATLSALRGDTAELWPDSDSTVLHVPSEWSAPVPGPAALAEQVAVSPQPPMTLPRRKPQTEALVDVDGSWATGLTEPTTTPPAAMTTTELPLSDVAAPPLSDLAVPPLSDVAAPEQSLLAVPAPSVVAAPEQSLLAAPAPSEVATPEESLLAVPPPSVVVLPTPSVTDTRRSRHEAVAAADLRMPAVAPRRRAGLFSRLLTVRTFRAQQGQPRVTKQQAAVCALLDAAATSGVLSLHNRRVPGRRGRIEHLAVGAAGIYVVDVLHFKNASIEVRPAGDSDAGTDLIVGGRVLTPAVRAVAQRVEVLRMILLAAGLADVPVTGALCFVDGLLPLSVADLQVGGMHVLRPSGLTALVAGPGAIGARDRETLREFLAERLPAST
jgi:hypothetical protein